MNDAVSTGAPPDAVLVRRAMTGDAEAVAVLQDVANEGHLSTHDWSRPGADWRRIGAAAVASNDTEMGLARTIVAERGGAVVGMLNYADGDVGDASDDDVSRPFLRLRARLVPCLYLRAMAVVPSERGRGVAGRLLGVAIAAARAEARAVGVIVHDANERLIARYERLGFVRVASEAVESHHSYPPGSSLIGLRLSAQDEPGANEPSANERDAK